jgi:glycerol dehydrogenase-like iron-containing ADH family enzyme
MPHKLNNNRKWPDGTSPRPDLSGIKRTEATDRQEYYDKLTVEQKIAALDKNLGVGVGAKKQRARFAALLNKKNIVVAPTTTATTTVPAELLSEIEEINEAASSKKRIKAKDRKRMEKGETDEETT